MRDVGWRIVGHCHCGMECS